MEFRPVRCPQCQAVVMDEFGLRGVIRPICPRCKRRVWIQGDGKVATVIRVDKKPSNLPRSA